MQLAAKLEGSAAKYRLRLLGSLAAVLIGFTTSRSVEAVPTYTPGGCATVNSGGFNQSNTTSGSTTSRHIAGFVVGDKITFQITRTNGASGSDGAFFSLLDVTANLVANSNDTVSTTLVYTVVGPDDLSLAALLEHAGHDATVTASCIAAAAGGGNTDSGRLRSVQVLGSRIVAQNSGTAISGAVSGAIGDALGGGNSAGASQTNAGFAAPAGLGGPGSGANALGGPALRLGSAQSLGAAGHQASITRQSWHAWASVRMTDIDRSNGTGSFTGDQVNALAGIGYRLSPGFVIGVLGGMERFDYEVRALAGSLKGDGWTAGTYAGWQIAPGLRLDLTGAYSGLDYDATAGTAAGSFTGRRWLASGASPAPIRSPASSWNPPRGCSRSGKARAPTPTTSARDKPSAASRRAGSARAAVCSRHSGSAVA